MRRFALLATLALGVGCDDPEVAGKITDVLQYGAVSAQVKCAGTVDTIGCDPSPYFFSAHLMVDGSSVVTYKLDCSFSSARLDVTRFNERGQVPGILAYPFTGGSIGAAAGGGDLTFDFVGSIAGSSPLDHHPTVSLTATDCIGRNLEAFGVVP
jgi:hypothetical protein